GSWELVTLGAPLAAHLPLFQRVRLRAVGRGVILRLGRGRVEDAEVLFRRRDVVPAAVLEIDHGLVVAIDGDDAPDDALEAPQLGLPRVDLHKLIGPLALQRLGEALGRLHRRTSVAPSHCTNHRNAGPPSRGAGSKSSRFTK